MAGAGRATTADAASSGGARRPSVLSGRDRAILRAVAAGRCVVAGLQDMALRVDGLCCTDQFAGVRLSTAGLIAPTATGQVRLTPAGRAAV